MGKAKDYSYLIGQTYGRLTVLKILSESVGWRGNLLGCICKCGKEKATWRKYLIRGSVKSCGCLGIEQRRKFSTGEYRNRPDGKELIEHCKNMTSDEVVAYMEKFIRD